MKKYSMAIGIFLIVGLLMVEASMIGCAKKDKKAERREHEQITQVSDLKDRISEEGDWEVYVYSEVTDQVIKHYSVRNSFVFITTDEVVIFLDDNGKRIGIKNMKVIVEEK